jgi:hypothetical protein
VRLLASTTQKPHLHEFGLRRSDSCFEPCRIRPDAMNLISKQPRDRDGHFCGMRVNVESVPRPPAFPARWLLDDPRGRAYFVFWTTRDGNVACALRVDAIEDDHTVTLRNDAGRSFRVGLVCRLLPTGGGTDILYQCAGCRCPRRYLYGHALKVSAVTVSQLIARVGVREKFATLLNTPEGRAALKVLAADLDDEFEWCKQRVQGELGRRQHERSLSERRPRPLLVRRVAGREAAVGRPAGDDVGHAPARLVLGMDGGNGPPVAPRNFGFSLGARR